MRSLMVSEDTKDPVCFVARYDCLHVRAFLEELNDPDGEPLMAFLRETKSFRLYIVDGMHVAGDNLLKGDIGEDVHTISRKDGSGEFTSETYQETLESLTPEEVETRVAAYEHRIN